MRLSFENKKFIFRGGTPGYPSSDGWTRELTLENTWSTRSIQVAARLREYADEATKKVIDRRVIQVTPWSGRIPYPKKEKITAHQREAVNWAMSRNVSYLALDPGMGKSVIAALIINAMKPEFAAVFSPPHLHMNMEKELTRWTQKTNAVQFISIFSDSKIADSEQQKIIQTVTSKFKPSLLIVDEAHRFKMGGGGYGSDASERCKALLGKANLVGLFDKVVYMSGTPMPNRPMELYPILKRSAPEVIDSMTRFEYGVKYCGGFQDRLGHWNFKGASNTEELFSRMKEKFMLRIRKDDADFTSKTEQLVFLDESKVSYDFTNLDRKLLEKYSPDSPEIPEDKLSEYRRMLGVEKVIPAINFLKAQLWNTDDNFLVFAHHKDVIRTFCYALPSAVSITGDDSKKTKSLKVAEFQKNKKCRVMVASITAAGTGLTLTKANRVIFVEFLWSPEDNRQAADRVHRIGQKKDVLIQYLVFKNSLDRVVLETNLRKREVIDTL